MSLFWKKQEEWLPAWSEFGVSSKVKKERLVAFIY